MFSWFSSESAVIPAAVERGCDEVLVILSAPPRHVNALTV